ncbi:hypothetical protein [Paenibacillus polymyxa]|uniref:hypothetical protein n=1 Tax=Paenibacillus TaxID=44249 RepID=UPI002024B270|nr:hypothetical protein [Paenibacillus polymyxa]URJ42165.1 hypothetical protein MF627_001819 [Paenibacillus polymyxa]
MPAEASAVRNGGFGYLDKNGIFHIESTEAAAKKESKTGKVVSYSGPTTYGYPAVPRNDGEYDQLAITLHADGSLTEHDGIAIPAHIAKVVRELQ